MKKLLMAVMAGAMFVTAANAQNAQNAKTFKEEELAALLAPIAL